VYKEHLPLQLTGTSLATNQERLIYHRKIKLTELKKVITKKEKKINLKDQKKIKSFSLFSLSPLQLTGNLAFVTLSTHSPSSSKKVEKLRTCIEE
jgi:DNA-binding Xre family transcriptional regulator